jgi:hypothetical protein
MGTTISPERLAAAVALVEPILIPLSTILDLYGFNSLDHRCIFPGQQVVFVCRRCVRPCLAQSVVLRAFHIRMSKQQAQPALNRLLEGPFFYLLRWRENAEWGQTES